MGIEEARAGNMNTSDAGGWAPTHLGQTLADLAKAAPLPNPTGPSAPPAGRKEPPRRPPVEELELNTFALCQGPDLDRTFDQVGGSRDRAYAAKLYLSVEDALEDVPARTLAWARRVLSTRSSGTAARYLAEVRPLRRFEVRNLRGTARGRDYRLAGCQIENPFDQLAYGNGSEPAWTVVRGDRDVAGAQVARIPDGTTAGLFFGFLAGCRGLAAPVVAKAPAWAPPNMGEAPWRRALSR